MTPENEQSSGPFITPIEDIKRGALEHYGEISTKSHHWMGFIPLSIMAYDPELESKQKAFIEWLDKEIEDAEKFSKRHEKETAYWEGANGALQAVKSMFLSLTPPPIK